MDTTTTLAAIVSDNPAAARVLQRHGLDFCCGGKRTLAEACQGVGLDATQILGEVGKACEPIGDIDVTGLSQTELVHHILRRYHEPLRPELARLLALARKAARVHGDKPEWPEALVARLEVAFPAIEEHLAKEEQILFPAIESGRGFLARMPILVMMREHEDHGANLGTIRALTDDYRPPAAACATWRILYRGLAELELDLMKHIHVENNILFPRALNEEGEAA